MCNYLRSEFTPIPKSGYAWKIFRKVPKSDLGFRATWKIARSGKQTEETVLTGMFRLMEYKSKRGWINWQDWTEWHGFCAFKTRAEARRAKKFGDQFLSDKYTSVLKRIQYRKGLGLQDEPGMFTGQVYKTIIIKSFKVL